MPATAAIPVDHRSPDQRLLDEVKAALSATGYQAVGTLTCDVQDGEVTLSGVLSSYYLKQVAQAAAARVAPAGSVRNAIRVE